MCDTEKNGNTVCLLNCQKFHAVKGSKITECNIKDGTFDPKPAGSRCVPTRNEDFEGKYNPRVLNK